MDKTFTETLGLPAFDWRYALKHPEKYNHGLLMEKARKWTTCACGNLCAIIPRRRYNGGDGDGADGIPVDPILAGLGTEFYWRVRAGDWDVAEWVLDAIEERSGDLIKVELAKLNQYEANNTSEVPA